MRGVEFLRISLGLTTGMRIKDGLEFAQIAEDSGYYRVFVGEDVLSREVFTYLSLVSLRTQRVLIASGIVSLFARNISLIASGAAGIQELSGERFTLGIGIGGGPEIEKLTGKRPEKVGPVLWESTVVLKQLFNKERVTYKGVYVDLDNYKLDIPFKAPPEIYFGVRGPKLLAIAGELADGVIFSGPKAYLFQAVKMLDEAAEKAGRNPKEIARVLWNPLVVTEKVEELEPAKNIVVTIISTLPPSILKYLEDQKEQIEAIKLVYEAGDYYGMAETITEASKKVTQEILDQFCITGSVEEISETFKEYQKEGFQEFVIGPPYGGDPKKAISAFKIFTGA